VRTRDELFREACRIAIEAGGFRMAWIGVIDQKTLDGKVVAQAPLVAIDGVAEAGFFKRLWHELLMWWESV